MNLAELLKADEGSRPQKFSIYIADRDENNNPKDVGNWIDRGRNLMTEINGGCTQLSVSKGAWIHSKTGRKIIDDTIIIYSYLFNPENFIQEFHQIVRFLHDYGIETEQDYVMCEFSGYSEKEKTYISESYFIPEKNYLRQTEFPM